MSETNPDEKNTQMSNSDAERVMKKLFEVATATKNFLLEVPIELLGEAIHIKAKNLTGGNNECLVLVSHDGISIGEGTGNGCEKGKHFSDTTHLKH